MNCLRRRLQLLFLLAHGPSSPSIYALLINFSAAVLAPIRCDGVKESEAVDLQQPKLQRLIAALPRLRTKMGAAMPPYEAK